jgi:hypothetical protein
LIERLLEISWLVRGKKTNTEVEKRKTLITNEKIFIIDFVKKTTENTYPFFYQATQKPMLRYFHSPRISQKTIIIGKRF